MPIIEATFAQADAIKKGEQSPDNDAIAKVFDRWVSSDYTIQSMTEDTTQ